MRTNPTGQNVSYWHGVPLGLAVASSTDASIDAWAGAVTIWITNEIPKGTTAKFQTDVSAQLPMACCPHAWLPAAARCMNCLVAWTVIT